MPLILRLGEYAEEYNDDTICVADGAPWPSRDHPTQQTGRWFPSSIEHDEQQRVSAPMIAAPVDEAMTRPRYRPSEAARWLLMPDSTLRRWLRERVCVKEHPQMREVFCGDECAAETVPLIPSVQTEWCEVALPFMSLVAAHNLHIMLSDPWSQIRLGLVRETVRRCHQSGEPISLASRRFPPETDIWPFVYAWNVPPGVSQTRAGLDWSGRVKGVEYDENGDPIALNLPTDLVQKRPVLRIDPKINFGEPSFVRGAAPLCAVRSRCLAGEPLDEVASDYGAPSEHIAAALRIHYGDVLSDPHHIRWG